MSEKIYLETTAIIDVVLKKRIYPKLASVVNHSNKKYSSQYTKMELKRGFLNYLVLLHNKISNSENWSDIEHYFSKLSSTPLRNQLSTMLNSMASCWEKFENLRPADLKIKYGEKTMSDIKKKDSISFLRTWIPLVMKKMDKICDEILNPMKCFNDLRAPVKDGDLFLNRPISCSTSKVKCEAKQFFTENSTSFSKIFEGLKSIPEGDRDSETKKRISALKKINKKILSGTSHFSNHSQDQKLCWNCGDAVHAVLAPSDGLVVNRNEKHFDDICRFIDKKSYSYDNH